jgi:hypothetical protein
MPSCRQNHARSGGAHHEGNLNLQEFPVTELTEALGCPRANPMEVTKALIELGKIACSRFGVPSALKKTIGSLINASNHEDLLTKPSDLPPDTRWERLASAIIPPVPDGFPIATLRTTSAAALEVLKESVASLGADLKELRLKPIAHATAMALQDQMHVVRGMANENPELREENLRALRQLQIYHKVGPEWAMVTPLEHLFLSWCASPEEPVAPTPQPASVEQLLDRGDRSSPPSAALLEHLGLIWAWSNRRDAWEPSPKSSKFQNSTLFDLPSRYFDARLDQDDGSLSAATRRLFEELRDARRSYERSRDDKPVTAQHALHDEQSRILGAFLGIR